MTKISRWICFTVNGRYLNSFLNYSKLVTIDLTIQTNRLTKSGD
jgi:hypothetical protein